MVGLYIYPRLLPPDVQLSLLNKLLHRDLCNPEHKTNVHMHYHVSYPAPPDSYFDQPSSNLVFSPRDPSSHKPITTAQYLTRKLRWMTLGGQYDWTRKLYPTGPPPAFPADLKHLIESLFPIKAEAAIVNLYSPGDTLSLHRDVSEECNQPLVSISLGCDGIFIAGLNGDGEDGGPRVSAMRLRSGDAVLMSGEARYAWHGVPKIVEGSCPGWMADWPGIGVDGEEGGRFAQWKGWMAGKRINLNVRQMFD
jgi:alkylated DNA repair protein alkB family protein 1